MLYINDRFHSEHDYLDDCHQFFNLDYLKPEKRARLAVCIEDTALWLSLCLYCQQHRLSVMPIPANTPRNRAVLLAQKAHCEYLIFNDVSTPLELKENTSNITIQYSENGLIQMSSGTTGEPKVIERTWQSIEQEIQSYITAFTLPNNMTPVVACPVTHSYGLICGVMMAIARGKHPHIITNINPKFLIKTLSHIENHLLYASPTLLDGLIRLWPKNKKLHGVMTSGTIMTQATFEQLRSNITHLFQQYGCSEAGCISVNQNLTHPSNLGNPLPHINLQVSKDPSNPSEIIINIKPLNSDKNSNNTLIHTRDLGYTIQSSDDKPCLYYLSRMDDTILVAGLNVYPQDIENTVLTFPEIEDAVAFKIEDQYAGQRVCLYYTSKDDLESNQVRQWCIKNLAPYQVPHSYRQVNKIDRMPNGKINRINLANTFQNNQTHAIQ